MSFAKSNSKRVFIIILIWIVTVNGFCQTNYKHERISVDFLKLISREVVIGWQTTLLPHLKAELLPGYMYKSPFYDNLGGFHYYFTSPFDKPHYIYNGPTFRTGVFCYPGSKYKKQKFYIGAQLVMMYIGYNHEEFSEETSMGYDLEIRRSEKTEVTGGELIMGYTFKMDKKGNYYSNIFLGSGYRYNFRRYTNEWGYPPSPWGYQLGKFREVYDYYVFVFGYRFLFEFNYSSV